MMLCQHCLASCGLTHRQVVQSLPAEKNDAGIRTENAIDTFEQRALPAPIGSDNTNEFFVIYRKRNLIQNQPAVKTLFQFLYANLHCTLP